MQRLMRRFWKDDQGAVAVIVAIVMTVLLAMAAVSIDATASWARQHQLQNGADAAALAIAQNCARNACGSPATTAQTYVNSNSYDSPALASVLGPSAGVVTVHATDPSFQHWFAPVLGPDHDSSVIGAEATAKYGWPVSGTTLPITFSWCEWNTQTGGLGSTTEHVINFTKKSVSVCTGPSGLSVPGGFGWVKTTTPGKCDTASMINQIIGSDTGNVPPNGCTNANFLALLNTVILIPIFDQYAESGANATYHVYGYAAFKFTGYYFNNTFKSPSPPCSSPNRCLKGYFTRYVDLNEVLEIGTIGPQLGAAIVTLVK
jgi:Flp pilus assembly protein TadG